MFLVLGEEGIVKKQVGGQGLGEFGKGCYGARESEIFLHFNLFSLEENYGTNILNGTSQIEEN